MKSLFSVLSLTAFGIAALSIPTKSYAQDHITIKCKSTEAHCPTIPKPPAPPKPPLPPLPPAAPTINFEDVAQAMSPEPPSKPEAPQQAHAACQNKIVGQKITWIVDQKNELSGTCIQKNGKMELDIKTIKLNS